ncbi:hypothetical protein EBT31_09825 [bacterium]|jgi:hypothetical protein|nr:hypothetical protein [bacterium]
MIYKLLLFDVEDPLGRQVVGPLRADPSVDDCGEAEDGFGRDLAITMVLRPQVFEIGCDVRCAGGLSRDGFI